MGIHAVVYVSYGRCIKNISRDHHKPFFFFLSFPYLKNCIWGLINFSISNQKCEFREAVQCKGHIDSQ